MCHHRVASHIVIILTCCPHATTHVLSLATPPVLAHDQRVSSDVIVAGVEEGEPPPPPGARDDDSVCVCVCVCVSRADLLSWLNLH